jgi:glutamine synthetase
MPDGSPFEGDPRHILKKQLERAKKLGYVYNVGPELEFFLFRKENGKLLPLPHDTAGYFDQTTDLAMEIRQEMTSMLRGFGIDVEALHHEVAVGQHEIDFRYADALTIADQATTFKYTLKYVAAHHNLHATFMPKPIAGINGSGMHVHQSLFTPDRKTNLFFDKKDSYHLSKIAKSFIMGQLTHIKAMNAILNPIVNSYKRLVVGYEAPVYIAWGQTNRSALMRIPRYTVGREKAVRAELRCPDPAANPYLAFAVMLAAGLDGIEKKMTPPPPVEENIYELSDDEAAKRGIGRHRRVCLRQVRRTQEKRVGRIPYAGDTVGN